MSLNKKMQVKADGKVYQLWFNNYAMFEIAATFGIDQRDIVMRCVEKLQENFLILVADLFLAGYKGFKLAKEDEIDLTRADVMEIVATANVEDLYSIWEVFKDANALNLEEEDSEMSDADKKKVKK